ncbi:MAG: N-acetylmuramoyl-L-alanine amidase [Lachnospiraceae bacterium]|nr:N-acetylmuramoyl-L-alanine amidase [Lachnospiraceae bacterium]
MKKRLELYMAIVLLAAAAILSKKGAAAVSNMKVEQTKYLIVLDAGHGGSDPGKIGIHGEKEKDINLQIVEKIKVLLEQNDVTVVLTRDSDVSLADAGASNQKVCDMRNRVALIEKTQPQLVVSIHQNSYTQESIRGAQCFYYAQSAEGKQIAEILQENMKTYLDPENHREAKANESYYLLKKTASPTVIVECGFLSNDAEATLLSSEEYQNQVAWAVYMGIMQCLNKVTPR